MFTSLMPEELDFSKFVESISSSIRSIPVSIPVSIPERLVEIHIFFYLCSNFYLFLYIQARLREFFFSCCNSN